MIIGNHNFGRVWGGSGVQGFFGDCSEYWHHRVPLIGPNFADMTFVSKTTTFLQRDGFMPLNEKLQPREWKPRCIVIRPWPAVVLNAVGLSGPGATALLDDGRWQARTKPFVISFMSVAKTTAERLLELMKFIELLQDRLANFHAPIVLQINFSCPNVGLDPSGLLEEIGQALTVAAKLGIPLMPKINILVPAAVAKQISDHPHCAGLCVSNTIHWDDMIRLNGDEPNNYLSPLVRIGGGGVSGRPLLPLLLNWLHQAAAANICKPINAGGGILSPADAVRVWSALGWLPVSHRSIFLATMAIVRPWRIQKTIRTVNAL